MVRRALCVVLGVFLIGAPVASVRATKDSPELRQKFLRGVAESWKQVQKMSFRADCEVTRMVRTSGKPPDGPHVTRFVLGIQGNNGLRSGTKKGIRYVQASNDDYAFVILESPSTGKYSVQFLEQKRVSAAIDSSIEAAAAESRAIALAAYCLWMEPLAQIVKQKTFEIQRVYSVAVDGRTHVKVEFDYRRDDRSPNGGEHYRNGYVICDPARKWVVCEYGATLVGADGVEFEWKTMLEHRDAVGDMPLATKIANHLTRRDVGYQSDTVLRLRLHSGELTEEELRLSHYGLPEPNFRNRLLGPWVWYLAGSVALIAIGIVVLKWHRSRR